MLILIWIQPLERSTANGPVLLPGPRLPLGSGGVAPLFDAQHGEKGTEAIQGPSSPNQSMSREKKKDWKGGGREHAWVETNRHTVLG